MRTYTSIEQSLELSKILPIDSSDMCHIQEYPTWSIDPTLVIQSQAMCRIKSEVGVLVLSWR